MEISPYGVGKLAGTDSSLDRGRVVAAWLLSFSSENTRQAYRRDIRLWLDWTDTLQLDLADVRRVHVDAWSRTMETDGAAAATIGRRIAAVSSLYRYGILEDLLTVNPAADVRRPRVADQSATFGPDHSQVAAMIAAATAPQDRMLVLLLALNGLRVSEATALDADAIEHERGHVVISVPGKGGRVDRVPLPPATCDALGALDRREGPLLVDSRGQRLNRHQAARIVARIARAAGIDHRVTPHGLRHSAVTVALDAGVPLRDVQDMARHADPRTTRRYDLSRQSLDRHAAYAIAQAVT